MIIYTLEVFIISGPVDKKFIRKNPVLSSLWKFVATKLLQNFIKSSSKPSTASMNIYMNSRLAEKVPMTQKPESMVFLHIMMKYLMTLSWLGM